MGKGSAHYWHAQKAKRAKAANPEKYAAELAAKRKKNRGAMESSKARKAAGAAAETTRMLQMPDTLRKATLAESFAKNQLQAVSQIAKVSQAAKNEIDPDYLLTGLEMRLLVTGAIERYGTSVFKILRAAELGADYSPGVEEIKAAYKALCKTLVNNDIAAQVLRYHIDAERKRSIKKGAGEDELVDAALESLRGFEAAPLIADVETVAAYTLWSRAGSWLGAMELAGLDLPLTKDGRRAAVNRYRAVHASVELLPEGVRKRLTQTALDALNEICKAANKRGRLLYDFEIPQDTGKAFKTSGYKVWELLRLVGLTQTTGPAPKEILAEKRSQEGC